MQRLVKILDRSFYPGYHFHIPKIVKDDTWRSHLELVSKFVTSTGNKHTEIIQPSIEQFSHLFGDVHIVQNPSETHKSLFQTSFVPILSKKFYIFIIEFEVGFTDTLA